jgi:hypothetical protein
LKRSDAAIIDTSFNSSARVLAVERVDHLYNLLSLCRRRQAPPNLEASLEATEAGRARLLADALALDEARLEELNEPDAREQITAARLRRDTLRRQLGYDRAGEQPRSLLVGRNSALGYKPS